MLFFRADTTVFSRKTLIFLSWTAAGCSTGISLEKAFVFADYPDHDCVRTGRFDGEKAVLSALHGTGVLCCAVVSQVRLRTSSPDWQTAANGSAAFLPDTTGSA